MIAYLKGNVTYVSPSHIVLVVNNIGYEVYLSSRNLDKINKNDDIEILTHLYVRDEVLQLYGFAESLELELFRLLIGVSGVGPKAALVILSQCSCEEIVFNINNESSDFFIKVPGIGKKTAQRIILDLKDKTKKMVHLSEPDGIDENISSDIVEQTISGLLSLGYSSKEIQGLVRETAMEIKDTITVEKLLNQVLKKLATYKRVK